MGFFSDLFKKKEGKVTQEQLDEIEEKVEETQEKHVKDGEIISNLSKPAKTVAQKPVKIKVKKSIKKSNKSVKKKN